MKWENFKSRFKKDAQAEEVEVDLDAIWSAIEPSVDLINQKKRKKKRFFFWIFLVGALCLGGTAYFLFPSTSTDFTSVTPQSESKGINENLTSLQNTTNNTTQTVTPATQLTNSSLTSTTDESDATHTALAQQGPIQKRPATKTKNQITKNQISSKNKSQNNTSKPNSNIRVSTQSETNSTAIIGTKNEVTKYKSPVVTKTTTARISPTQELTKSTLRKQSERSENAILNTSSIHSLAAQMSDLSRLQTDFYTYPLVYAGANFAKITLPENPFTSDTKVTKAAKKFRFAVGATGGVSYVNRKLTAKEIETEENKIIRNQYEKSLEAVHFGINIAVQHRTGLRLSLGLQQTTITDLYQLNKTEVTEGLTEGVQTLKVNLYGDTTAVMGEILQTTTTITNKAIYNTYRLLDLPIILAYQRSFGRWKAGVELGVLVNLSLRTKGIIPNTDFQDIDIAEKQGEYFKSNIGLSYHLGLSLRRQLSDAIEVHFTPSLRYFPQDFSAESYTLKQEYMLFGANFGINYRF